MKKIFLLIITLIFTAQLSFAGNTVKKIYLFYTNDLHGHITEQKARFLNPNFPPELGGGASVATIVNSYRKKARQNGDVVLLLDAGDFLGKTSDLVQKSGGKAIIQYMNRIGYDALVPGIEDFSVAGDSLLKLANLATFPFLGTNILFKDQNSMPFDPYVVLERNGLKIGLFGILSQSVQYIDEAGQIKNFHFTAELEAAEQAVKVLKKQGCDLIIALAHLGLPYDPDEYYPLIRELDRQQIIKKSFLNAMDLAHYLPGIDVIVSGKTHRGYNIPWEDPLNHTICVQNYARGSNLGAIVLRYDMQNKTLLGYDLLGGNSALLLLTKDEFWPDRSMKRFIDSLQTAYDADAQKVIGYTLNTLKRSAQGESPFGNLMCDAMLEASGADFAFNNYNSLRQTIPIGPITRQDVIDALPFANELVVIEVTGKMLKDLMERSVVGSFMGVAIAGGKVVYDPSLPDGKRVVLFEIQGKPVTDDRVYRIATSAYIAQGNSGMTPLSFLDDDKFTFTGISIREAVMRYIEKYSPLKIETDGRWKRK